MIIGERHFRTIWLNGDGCRVDVIDQTLLPHRFAVRSLTTLADAADAIRTMVVRGAPLIGATAAYGVALAMNEDASDAGLERAHAQLLETRPTAVNLRWALERVRDALAPLSPNARRRAAYELAAQNSDEDVGCNRAIGEAGLAIMETAARKKRLNVLTHCNAGWLATVDFGTALAPVYMAHDAGLDAHVFVDETRPRNQGASLTAFELASHGVRHTLISDNAGGHLMQKGEIDLCLVGADRVTADGAVCNKIGTYLKALAAKDNGVPFYACFPESTVDWQTQAGERIPIEERSAREVTHIQGLDAEGAIREVAVATESTPARNPAFDVTPPRLVTGYITDRGFGSAGRADLARLFGKSSSA